MELQDLIRQIDALKAEIDSLRPLDPEREARVMQKFRLDWNYHSSNIEGNSLTYGETKTFLLHGLTASGKPLKDHLEIKGHNEAIQSLEDLVKEEQPLTEYAIRSLNQVILGKPYSSPAQTADGKQTQKLITPGQYKRQPNHVITVTGEIFRYADPVETPEKMESLLSWYHKSIADPAMHPLLVAALFHYEFIRIHPFDDGNGRIARILMNVVLMMKGYPPAIIRTEDKVNYLRALRQADGGDESAFVDYIGQQIVRSMEIYIKGAKGETVEDLSDIDKRIALFKAQIDKTRNQIEQGQRSTATITAIVHTSVIPLFEQVLGKLRQFDDLFAERVITLQPSERIGGYRSGDQLIADLTQLKWQGRDRAILNYRLKGFIYSNRGPVDYDTFLGVTFRESDYIIEPAFAESIVKSYNDSISDTEQLAIANAMAEAALKRIEKYISPG